MAGTPPTFDTCMHLPSVLAILRRTRTRTRTRWMLAGMQSGESYGRVMGVSPLTALNRFFKRKLGTDAVPDHMLLWFKP
jgi:hypothetical protein